MKTYNFEVHTLGSRVPGRSPVWLALTGAVLCVIALATVAHAAYPSSGPASGLQHRSPAHANPQACMPDFNASAG